MATLDSQPTLPSSSSASLTSPPPCFFGVVLVVRSTTFLVFFVRRFLFGFSMRYPLSVISLSCGGAASSPALAPPTISRPRPTSPCVPVLSRAVFECPMLSRRSAPRTGRSVVAFQRPSGSTWMDLGASSQRHLFNGPLAAHGRAPMDLGAGSQRHLIREDTRARCRVSASST